MGIPKSNIVPGKYTSGGEFAVLSTNTPYQGYYYELNNKFYSGKEYSPSSPEIIRIQSPEKNNLLNRFPTAIYSLVSGITSKAILTPPIKALPSEIGTISDRSTRFFCKKINSDIIKEIDEQTYKSLQSQPIYQITYIGIYQKKPQTLDQADQQVPGLKAFLAA
jgi:hypothetical protein